MLYCRSEPNSRSMLLPEFQVSQKVGEEEEGKLRSLAQLRGLGVILILALKKWRMFLV